MKIFLVEDNQPLNDVLSKTLKNIGYDVRSFSDGREAFKNISVKFDLYIIDINLPYINGLELIKSIKSNFSDANIFVISAEIDIDMVLKAYDIGINDYIKKPFDIRELVAKIKNNCFSNEVDVINFENNCKYDKKQRIFIIDGKNIKLTKKESLLLDILIKYKNRTVPNNIIESYVWPDNYKSGYVRQLISKIKRKFPIKIIENHSTNGYRIVPKIIN